MILERRIFMKKLIIITGISGTGKSSLARTLYDKLENSTLISFDTLLENVYDILGFKDKEQKESLRKINNIFYKKLIKEALFRGDEIVIVEYPFAKEWKKYFLDISLKYNYKMYTINMFAKDFDTIWNRLKIRENSSERHPSHYLQSYFLKNKNKYVPFFEYDYKKHKESYENKKRNSINLGTVININDIEEVNIDQLIKSLE